MRTNYGMRKGGYFLGAVGEEKRQKPKKNNGGEKKREGKKKKTPIPKTVVKYIFVSLQGKKKKGGGGGPRTGMMKGKREAIAPQQKKGRKNVFVLAREGVGKKEKGGGQIPIM